MANALDYLVVHDPSFQSPARLSSLYSDFAQTAVTNPDGYEANVTSWMTALALATRSGMLPGHSNIRDLLILHTGKELAQALYSNKLGTPLALGCVVGEAVQHGELVPLPEFMSSRTSIYKKGWVPTLGQVASWSLRKLGVIGRPAPSRMTSGDYVVTKNVEAFAKAILDSRSRNNSPVASIYSYSTFLLEYAQAFSASTTLSAADLQVLLKYLSRDKQALSYNKSTIKFSGNPSVPPTPVTIEDEAIANLMSLMSSTQSQIPLLEQRISALDARARSAVQSKVRTSALSALRSKKIVEGALATRLHTLTQLEDIHAKVQAASDNVEMVKVMASSADVLRSLNKQVGGTEGAERVADSLKEEISTVEDITSVLHEVGAEGASVDETDVDEEFEALERAEQVQREAREKASKEKVEAEEARIRQSKLEELERWETENRQDEPQLQSQQSFPPTSALTSQGQSRSNNGTGVDPLEASIGALQNLSLTQCQDSKLTTSKEQVADTGVQVVEGEAVTAT